MMCTIDFVASTFHKQGIHMEHILSYPGTQRYLHNITHLFFFLPAAGPKAVSNLDLLCKKS